MHPYRTHTCNELRVEDAGKTVVEGDPELEVSRRFLALAELLLNEESERNP